MITVLDGDRAQPGSNLNLMGTMLSDHEGNFTEITVTLNDSMNHVLATGNMIEFSVSTVEDGSIVTAKGTLQLPDTIPVSPEGTTYFIVWTAVYDSNKVNSVEQLFIYTPEAVEFGLSNSVGISENPIPIHGVVEGVADEETVFVSIYTPVDHEYTFDVELSKTTYNAARAVMEGEFHPNDVWYFVNGEEESVAHNPNRMENGDASTYTVPGDSTIHPYNPDESFQLDLPPALDPYTLQWYKELGGNRSYIGSSQSWVINHTISQAIHEMQLAVERGMSAPGFARSALSNEEYVQFLAMGRDYFNMLEKITSFTMLRADGPMRRAWVLCSQYEAMSSRQLEEAIKAFDFSGQSTSLSVDISAAYETMKSALESQIESIVRPYKRQLTILGQFSGDGDSETIAQGVPAMAEGRTWSLVGNGIYRHRAWRLRINY